MSEKLTHHEEEETLEQWAVEFVSTYFLPLAQNDLLYLERLEGNNPAWNKAARELAERWNVPDEEQQAVTYAIQKYAPAQDLKKGT